MEVNNIVEERRKANSQREQEMKMEMLKVSSNMPLQNLNNTSIGKLMNK